MGWVIAFLVLLLIAAIPIGANAKYSSDGILVRIIAGFFRFTIIPFPKRKKHSKPASVPDTAPATKKTKQSKTKANSERQSENEQKKKQGGSLLDFLPLVRVGLDFLNTFRKKLRVDRLEMKLILAGDDPCDLAVNYGKAWAVVDNLLPAMERVLFIRKRNIEVECDFCSNETTIYVQLDITITIGRLIGMTVKYGFLALREFLILKKKRKGGVQT